jgi:DNA-directed RNA polymerase beta subunit
MDRLLYPGAASSLSSQLVRIIDEKIQAQTDTREKFVPDLITLHVSPEKWDAWQETMPTLNQVASEVEATWLEQGYQFRVPLRIQLAQNPSLAVDAIEVSMAVTLPSSVTSKTALQTMPEASAEVIKPERAYFIINGKEQVYLNKTIIKIGRRSSSDIQLDDPMISRDHLLLRAQHGHYLLFDLSSTGGTFVNNQPVKTATLKPGDVIRIGKTLLIYNQDVPGTGLNPTTIIATKE